MNFKKLLFTAAIVLSVNASFAQNDSNEAVHYVDINITAVALLDLEVPATGSTTFSLAGKLPTEAGLPMTFEDATAKNATIWMNYSSILGTGTARTVKVTITDGFVPAGLKLTVFAADYSGSGEGTMGTSSGIITLDDTDQEIIGGIGSAYTGNGIENGHLLIYQLGYADTANYAGLDADNSDSLTITYTLSDI